MSPTPSVKTADRWAADTGLWRCLNCGGGLVADAGTDALACPACGRSYPIVDGVLVARSETSANNQVARDFYDGPLWPKFRFWEWATFVMNGGERSSRDKILRHLPKDEGLRLLDVAIGDGVYLDWLPQSWSVAGIDISQHQLDNCKRRRGTRDLKLVMGEAEDLPFSDRTFDCALSIGGFNYFNDPEKSLREMARVVKPGGTIVVADEVPNLTDRMLFRKIGLPKVDRWIISKGLKLGDDFTDMVERYRDMDIAAIGERVLPGSRYELVWRGVGYVLVGQAPG
jgi:ubiquinone/menaquinone biosynthesis C-methylase UbiE